MYGIGQATSIRFTRSAPEAGAVCNGFYRALRCRDMALVYSQQRAGRPRLALLGSAGLLLLTVALARGVIERKIRLHRVTLGPVQDYPAGRLRARLPETWRLAQRDEPVEGVIVEKTEPVGRGELPRSIVLFRGLSSPWSVSSVGAAPAVERLAQALSPGLALQSHGEPEGRVGPFPAATWVMGGVNHVLTLSGPDLAHRFILARAATAPSGQVVGIMMLLPDPPRRSDEVVLDQIGEHVELWDAHPAADADAVMAGAGIRFDLPDGARLLEPRPTGLPRVQVFGGEGSGAWYANLCRSPLIEPREPDHWVRDFLASWYEQIEPTKPVEKIQGTARAFYGSSMELGRVGAARGQVFAARTDAQTGLLVVGGCEREGCDALEAFCRSVADQAEVEPYDDLFDVVEALETGRQWLRQIEQEGLATVWSPRVAEDRTYTIRDAGGIERGHETYTYAKSDDDRDHWIVNIELEIGRRRVLRRKITEQWSIAGDGRSHRVRADESSPGSLEIRSTEQRLDGGDEVSRTLRIKEVRGRVKSLIGERTDVFEVDDRYACQPVLQEAEAMVAADPKRRPAIFMASEQFPPQPVFWIVVPLGEQPLPWSDEKKTAQAVRWQRDYHPAPATIYFDDDGEPLGVGFDSGLWEELGEPKPITPNSMLEKLLQPFQ